MAETGRTEVTFEKMAELAARDGVTLLHPDHEKHQAEAERAQKEKATAAKLHGLMAKPSRTPADVAELTRLQAELRALVAARAQ